jgi:hypothetical protein
MSVKVEIIVYEENLQLLLAANIYNCPLNIYHSDLIRKQWFTLIKAT